MKNRIRWSAILISLGLLVQLGTLRGVHPLGFVFFLTVGCPLLLAGVCLFLLGLASKN